MPKLKPEELAARRLEIIEAARACFLRSGFHQTTTDEICHEASITPGGLYHYFGSKDELIAAVVEHSAEAATERMRTLIAEADDAESAFRQVAGFFFDAMQDTDIDNATRLEIEIWAEALMNDDLATTGRAAWKLRQDWLQALVQRGIDDGVYDAEVVEAGEPVAEVSETEAEEQADVSATVESEEQIVVQSEGIQSEDTAVSESEEPIKE